MPSFSERSKNNLKTCHPYLRDVFNEVIKHFDCTIIEGHRGKDKQDEYFAAGKSKVRWPGGKHNASPSEAVDVAPYPIDWNDLARFTYFAGFVKGIATSKGIKIRWGGDWSGSTMLKDNKFNDLVHFEVIL